MSRSDDAGAEGVDQLDDWERHLCAPLTGRKVICAFEVLAGMTAQVARLRRWGAQRPLLLGDGLGTGPVPLATEADIVVLDPGPATNLTDQVRSRITRGRDPDTEIVAAVERYDPAHEAVWWVTPIGPNEPILGRPVFGGRPSWQIDLEDKLGLDPILQAVGADLVPSRVSAADHAALTTASQQVADAAGTTSVVWAGDNRDGVNGGGDFVRLVYDAATARAGAEFFADRCDRVRVTPLLEGVPCSIHGMVLPDGVLVLRPVELFSLRDTANGTFFYGGMGTTWDPPAEVTSAMRRLAADVGHHLQDRYGLRGAFGLDGVVTADGFRVTELNPRFSGGLTRLSRTAPDLHLELVQLNALIGRDIDRRVVDLEAEALETLHANRIVDTMGWSTGIATSKTTYQRVIMQEDGLVAADDEDVAIGTVIRGNAASGTFVRLTVDDYAVESGRRGAPLALAMLRFADQTWGTGFGELTMAAEANASPAPS